MSKALKEWAIAKLSSTNVDMKTAAKTTLLTVPTGKVFIPFAVLVRNPSASMAGGTDYDFGSGANCDDWKQTVDLSSLTTLGTDHIWITALNTKYTEHAAADAFGVKVITGTTAACTADIDVFGILF
jgi:hypothetical protein